jgi:glyoxylase-like metal-dependent hydrolase (beta-lactamase superfamily II)
MLVKNPPQQIADGLWMLGTTAYPIYLLQGDGEIALVEGGLGAVAGPVLRQIDDLGIDRASIRQAVITHAHPDHVMALPALRQAFPGIKLTASDLAAKALAAEKTLAFFHQVDQAFTQSLVDLGWVLPEDRPAAGDAPAPMAIDNVVREGDTLQVGGAAFTVLETPGHSDCSISLYDPSRRVLVISDASGYYMPEQGAWWPNYFTGYAAYLASLQRLAQLGAEVLCLSHNGAITGAADVAEYFRGAIAATEAYHRRIVDAVRAGRPPRELATELGDEIYPQVRLLTPDFFQKNCMLLVKQSLRAEGIAT